MTELLVASLGVFLCATLVFPAIAKVRSFRRLSVYYTELFGFERRLTSTVLALLCAVEVVIGAALLFRIAPAVTGIAAVSLLSGFLVVRAWIIVRSKGRSACGCVGSTAEASMPESLGSLLGTVVLAGTAVLWTALANA